MTLFQWTSLILIFPWRRFGVFAFYNCAGLKLTICMESAVFRFGLRDKFREQSFEQCKCGKPDSAYTIWISLSPRLLWCHFCSKTFGGTDFVTKNECLSCWIGQRRSILRGPLDRSNLPICTLVSSVSDRVLLIVGRQTSTSRKPKICISQGCQLFHSFILMMVLLHDVPKNTSGCCGDPVLNEANAKEYDRNVLRCQRNSAGVPHGTAFIDVYNTISRY